MRPKLGACLAVLQAKSNSRFQVANLAATIVTIAAERVGVDRLLLE